MNDYDFFEHDMEKFGPNENLIEKYILTVDISNSSFQNLTPNQGGYEEYFKIRIDKFKKNTISIKIRAVDSNKNYAKWSPILIIKLNKNVTLSSNLKHYEFDKVKSQHSQVSGEKESSEKSFYWELLIFLIGTFIKFI